MWRGWIVEHSNTICQHHSKICQHHNRNMLWWWLLRRWQTVCLLKISPEKYQPIITQTISYIWVIQVKLTTLTFDFYFQLWLYVGRYGADLQKTYLLKFILRVVFLKDKIWNFHQPRVSHARPAKGQSYVMIITRYQLQRTQLATWACCVMVLTLLWWTHVLV